MIINGKDPQQGKVNDIFDKNKIFNMKDENYNSRLLSFRIKWVLLIYLRYEEKTGNIQSNFIL